MEESREGTGRPPLPGRPDQKATDPGGRPRAPLRDMSLGWRLGLTTAVIVTVVLGSLTLYNRLGEVHLGWQDRNLLLRESLAGLASELETASSLEEIREKISAFQAAYVDQGYAEHQIDLQDQNGQIIASTESAPDKPRPDWTLRASIPISSALLPHGHGILTAWRDATKFKRETEEYWLFSLVDILVGALCILLCLLIAHYFLVALPLRRLLKGIRQMEMGYWGGVEVPHGAWELRWLAYRFQGLGAELEETMRRLVDAERRALLDLHRVPNPPADVATGKTGEGDPAPSEIPRTPEKSPSSDPLMVEKNLMFQYLSDKCRLLESAARFDPRTQASARETWERDVLVAEHLGAVHLRSRLEDASLRILNPEGFEMINRELASIVAARKGWLKERESEIRKALQTHGVPFLEIQKRIKQAGSIWRKTHRKQLKLEQLHDIFAFRIIVEEERDCYRVLEAIHRRFEPQLLRFKDYIASPKPSGYQSIHTSVRSNEGFIFEVQIRTLEMHKRAEGGTAAHWRYKSDLLTGLDAPTGSRGVLRRLWSGLRRFQRGEAPRIRSGRRTVTQRPYRSEGHNERNADKEDSR